MTHGVLGVTGSHRGLTPCQTRRAAAFVAAAYARGFRTLVHGDCVGADVAVATLASSAGFDTHAYPANDVAPRYLAGHPSTIVHPAAPALVRNRTMVGLAGLLLAFPHEPAEVLRSGTWATVRYARAAGVPVVVTTPSGAVTVYPGGPEAPPTFAPGVAVPLPVPAGLTG